MNGKPILHALRPRLSDRLNTVSYIICASHANTLFGPLSTSFICEKSRKTVGRNFNNHYIYIGKNIDR